MSRMPYAGAATIVYHSRLYRYAKRASYMEGVLAALAMASACSLSEDEVRDIVEQCFLFCFVCRFW